MMTQTQITDESLRKIKASLAWRRSQPVLKTLFVQPVSKDEAKETLKEFCEREGVEFLSLYKAPFGFSFAIGDCVYRVKMSKLRFTYKKVGFFGDSKKWAGVHDRVVRAG
jgi:hypothetical protein